MGRMLLFTIEKTLNKTLDALAAGIGLERLKYTILSPEGAEKEAPVWQPSW